MLPKWIAQIWPRPALGLDERFDSLARQAVPNDGQPVSQSIHHADRGGVDRGAYYEQAYNVRQDHIVTPSLARETLMSWATAMWRVGGPRYPFDYGYGPGAHFDCMTPQFYMKPGVRPLRQAQMPKSMGPVTNFGTTFV